MCGMGWDVSGGVDIRCFCPARYAMYVRMCSNVCSLEVCMYACMHVLTNPVPELLNHQRTELNSTQLNSTQHTYSRLSRFPLYNHANTPITTTIAAPAPVSSRLSPSLAAPVLFGPALPLAVPLGCDAPLPLPLAVGVATCALYV